MLRTLSIDEIRTAAYKGAAQALLDCRRQDLPPLVLVDLSASDRVQLEREGREALRGALNAVVRIVF